ncbi:hypothetical protein LTR66_004615 [Elasticomyces elasticus]|nr:hypothetical protein LTR66_004615 [Elasticomyces elasticus]
MTQKHAREDDDAESKVKKRKVGFSVGPANLPDGTYRRKAIKIKKHLIEKAKIKKDYAKIKAREQSVPKPSAPLNEPNGPEPTTEPHAARQALIDAQAASPDSEKQPKPSHALRDPVQKRARKPKPAPFAAEYRAAQTRKEEAEVRRREREEAERQRQTKQEERERFRRAMAKARTGGRNGQRKLGRESTVLLERVKKIVGGE